MLTRRPIMLHALPSCSARFWATQRATSRHVLLPRRVHARTSSVSPSWLRSRVLMLSTTPFTRWQKTRLATLQDLQVSTRDTSSKESRDETILITTTYKRILSLQRVLFFVLSTYIFYLQQSACLLLVFNIVFTKTRSIMYTRPTMDGA